MHQHQLAAMHQADHDLVHQADHASCSRPCTSTRAMHQAEHQLAAMHQAEHQLAAMHQADHDLVHQADHASRLQAPLARDCAPAPGRSRAGENHTGTRAIMCTSSRAPGRLQAPLAAIW